VYDELFYFDIKDNQLSLAMEEDEIYQTHLIPKLFSHYPIYLSSNIPNTERVFCLKKPIIISKN